MTNCLSKNDCLLALSMITEIKCIFWEFLNHENILPCYLLDNLDRLLYLFTTVTPNNRKNNNQFVMLHTEIKIQAFIKAQFYSTNPSLY